MRFQGQERTSNDGAESVEAKQDATQTAQKGAAEAGSNQDAESVTAKDDASDDDSDIEEGEIAGLPGDIVRHNYVAGPHCISTCIAVCQLHLHHFG